MFDQRAAGIRETEKSFNVPIDALTKISELQLKVLQAIQQVKDGRRNKQEVTNVTKALKAVNRAHFPTR